MHVPKASWPRLPDLLTPSVLGTKRGRGPAHTLGAPQHVGGTAWKQLRVPGHQWGAQRQGQQRPHPVQGHLPAPTPRKLPGPGPRQQVTASGSLQPGRAGANSHPLLLMQK